MKKGEGYDYYEEEQKREENNKDKKRDSLYSKQEAKEDAIWFVAFELIWAAITWLPGLIFKSKD